MYTELSFLISKQLLLLLGSDLNFEKATCVLSASVEPVLDKGEIPNNISSSLCDCVSEPMIIGLVPVVAVTYCPINIEYAVAFSLYVPILILLDSDVFPSPIAIEPLSFHSVNNGSVSSVIPPPLISMLPVPNIDSPFMVLKLSSLTSKLAVNESAWLINIDFVSDLKPPNVEL